MLITGPNMGGKSTLMRSTCLAGNAHNSLNEIYVCSNLAHSHLGPHGRIRSLQLGEVQPAYVCIAIMHLSSIAGCLLSTEFSHALVPAIRSCWARAPSWSKCLKPLPFSATRPTGIFTRGLYLLSEHHNSKADLLSFSTSWDEAAVRATAVPSRSRWCRLGCCMLSSTSSASSPPLPPRAPPPSFCTILQRITSPAETAEPQQMRCSYQHTLPQLGCGDPAVPCHAHAHVRHRRRGVCQCNISVQACTRLQVRVSSHEQIVGLHSLCTQRPVLWAPLRCCCWTSPVCYFRPAFVALSKLSAVATYA